MSEFMYFMLLTQCIYVCFYTLFFNDEYNHSYSIIDYFLDVLRFSYFHMFAFEVALSDPFVLPKGTVGSPVRGTIRVEKLCFCTK